MKRSVLVGALSFVFGLMMGLWRPWHREIITFDASSPETRLLSIRNNGREIAWATAGGKCFEHHDGGEIELNCKQWAKLFKLRAPIVQDSP